MVHITYASLLLSATSVFAGPVVSRDYPTKIQWQPCPSPLPAFMQCAQYPAPIDYANPKAGEISLAIARVKSNSSQPKGSIFVNPGGPGGSAVELAAQMAALPPDALPAQLLPDYHIVGLDPRGVGQSAPIRCSADLWNKQVPIMVKNETEYKTMAQHWKEVGESCANMTGPLLNHVDTISVVRDLELVRAAIGESKLNWLGLSYGTQIGLTYAEMFPKNVGRMVLDGVVDHSQQTVYTLHTESTTYESTLHQFFAWCKTNKECALHDEDDIEGFFKNLTAKAEAAPLPAPSCKQTGDEACHVSVTLEKLMENIQKRLILVESPIPDLTGWKDLSEALLAASKGDAAILSPHYFLPNQTDSTGDWMELAVACQDFPCAASYTALANLLLTTHALSPLTRGYTQTLRAAAKCAMWPAKLINPPRPFRDSIQQAPRMLLVNSFWDPETSVLWAEAVKEQLANNTNLVFRNGSGHTSYLVMGETAQVINDFLVNGTMPADGAVYQS